MGTAPNWSQWLNVLINVLLPIVVAVVTSRAADGSVKALVLLVLSAASGFLTSWWGAVDAGQAFDLSQAGFTAVTGLVIAIAAHFGVWKPNGVTGSGGFVQQAMPAGMGGSRRPVTDPSDLT